MEIRAHILVVQDIIYTRQQVPWKQHLGDRLEGQCTFLVCFVNIIRNTGLYLFVDESIYI